MSLTSAFVGNLMRALTTVSGLALWVSAVAAAQTTTACETVLTPSYTSPVVAPGWKAALVAKGLTKPRGIIFDRKGRLLVVQQGVGVTRLDLVDHGDTCIWMSTSETILSDSQGQDQFGYNHGIEISADGRMLLVSTSEAVHAWLYDSERGRITKDSMRVLIRNMTSAGHVTRSLLLTRNQPPPSNPGDDGEEMPPRTYLLVSRGSSANVDTLAGDATSGISQIRAFDVAELYQATTPVDYASGGRLVGWGLRNSVGMGEHPATGSIWSVENSADDMARAGQDVHQDNPGEELNYHGTVESIFSEKADEALESKNRNYGYPFCYALWNTTDFPELGELKVGDQFMSNPDSKTGDQKCADEFISPRLTFQAHMAPLDIKFDPKNNGSRVFISFHGSWNRDVPVGYKLSYVNFSAKTGQPIPAADSVDSLVDIMTAADVTKCGLTRCFRPVGLAFDSTGERLFVSSDDTGEIWVIMEDKSENGQSGKGGDGFLGTGGGPNSSAGREYVGRLALAFALTAGSILIWTGVAVV